MLPFFFQHKIRILIFHLEKTKTVGNKKSLFEKLAKKQKNKKKYIVADVTSEQALNVSY